MTSYPRHPGAGAGRKLTSRRTGRTFLINDSGAHFLLTRGFVPVGGCAGDKAILEAQSVQVFYRLMGSAEGVFFGLLKKRGAFFV